VTDKPGKPEQITPAKTVTDTGIAPYIFFEGAPNFGFANGVVNVTLAAVASHLKPHSESVSFVPSISDWFRNAEIGPLPGWSVIIVVAFFYRELAIEPSFFGRAVRKWTDRD
jgi:hypothetical protein